MKSPALSLLFLLFAPVAFGQANKTDNSSFPLTLKITARVWVRTYNGYYFSGYWQSAGILTAPNGECRSLTIPRPNLEVTVYQAGSDKHGNLVVLVADSHGKLKTEKIYIDSETDCS
jgi:hypothetical protein